MKLASFLLPLVFVNSQSLVSSQDATARSSATVHLYRTGKSGVAVQVSLDVKEAFKIGDHKVATFAVQPGYHEISVNAYGQHPTAGIAAVAGHEYYFDLDMEVAGMKRMLLGGFGGTPQFIATIVRIEKAPDENFVEIKLDARQMAMLSSSASRAKDETQLEPSVISTLSDEEIAAAILQGNHDRDPNQIGLRLNDIATNMVSHALTPKTAVSGFTVVVYSPSRWVEYQAAVARRQLRPFGIANVTAEMRVKALHVVALPSSPDKLNGENMAAASGVLRTVVCDKNCDRIVQPLTEDQGTIQLNSALRSMDYTKLASTFNMTEVDRIRHEPGSESFYVAVVGENGSRKLFEVHNKFFSWM